MSLPALHLSGSPYQQGCQHGAALRGEIGTNLAIYFARFERELHLTRAETLRRARVYAEAIADQNPAYAAAMRGIADGSGYSYAEIAALNVRYELFYHQFGHNAMADGCTAIALLPTVTADGHLWLAENWDWIVGVRGAILHSRTEDGMTIRAFTEAGIVGGKIGFNSAGLGLLINGLTSSEDDWARLQRPFHLRCYEILHSHSLDAAISIVMDAPRSCSANFLLAQVPDRAVTIESAPHRAVLRPAQAGYLVHTNHFVDAALLGVHEPPVESCPHSHWRLERSEQLLAGQRSLGLSHLQTILRDHQQHPYGICFHIDPAEPPTEHYQTVVSVMMDLHAQRFYLSDGPPCAHAYAEEPPHALPSTSSGSGALAEPVEANAPRSGCPKASSR
ncbi:peptidase C45 acyl-coenzyme A:6-aminopenicillanic acid acyl-transferase [Oscillochloris trichoides DG-6]|uniref:Peptidase C45 acyl-coenzyme A:6-aminopenicillanic acid acyl-transferase n=1 Tax=Oscillochloris trichoides DG-6 TaxID=765420 RepID=E1IGQ2_9CHLR|nr:C45 family peptidase [Oscillochloris trichoides]EFO79639.1 peptidase C45 acyl-coenzyme A:6-aminopenicillanic acid acyl-transferase [Oscillochloris trichoides DG-6]